MHTADWIDTGSAWLRYALEGEGERTVVLLHEMGGTMDSWDEVVADLSRDHRLLRYDMRGFGLSQKIHGRFGLMDAVDDLFGLIDAAGIEGPVALAGCAFGAGVAMRAAAAQPGRVNALVAMAPATEIPEARTETARIAMAQTATMSRRESVEGRIAPNSYPEVLRTDPERFRRFMGAQCAAHPESIAALYNILLTEEFQRHFPAIACPTLVMAGRHDKARSPEVVAPIAAQIPGARFETVDSGHFMALQTPELVADSLRRFLADIPA